MYLYKNLNFKIANHRNLSQRIVNNKVLTMNRAMNNTIVIEEHRTLNVYNRGLFYQSVRRFFLLTQTNNIQEYIFQIRQFKTFIIVTTIESIMKRKWKGVYVSFALVIRITHLIIYIQESYIYIHNVHIHANIHLGACVICIYNTNYLFAMQMKLYLRRFCRFDYNAALFALRKAVYRVMMYRRPT